MKHYFLRVIGQHVCSIWADRMEKDEKGVKFFYAGDAIILIAQPIVGVEFYDSGKLADAIQSESCATAQIPSE